MNHFFNTLGLVDEQELLLEVQFLLEEYSEELPDSDSELSSSLPTTLGCCIDCMPHKTQSWAALFNRQNNTQTACTMLMVSRCLQF